MNLQWEQPGHLTQLLQGMTLIDFEQDPSMRLDADTKTVWQQLLAPGPRRVVTRQQRYHQPCLSPWKLLRLPISSPGRVALSRPCDGGAIPVQARGDGGEISWHVYSWSGINSKLSVAKVLYNLLNLHALVQVQQDVTVLRLG
jgi:hypothetical protein